MTDRYDEATHALRQVPVPDQWDEITRRFRAADDGTVVPLDLDGLYGGDGAGQRSRPRHARRQRRRWPVVLAAAACVAIAAGAVALFTREDPDVTTDSPAGQPDLGTPPSSATPEPSTEPGPDASVTTVPRPTVDDEGNTPVSACRGLPLSSSTPPFGISGTMQNVLPGTDEPRLPEAVRADLTGLFPGDTTTRAVFVVAGWPGLNDESGTTIDGPFPGTQSWISPYDEGWFAEISVPLSAEITCPTTLIGLGLTEADFRLFLGGVTLAE